LFLVALTLNGCAVFGPQSHVEARNEAMLLYRFSQFVEWPPSIFPNPKAPVIIGVLGDSSLANELEKILKDKRINGHSLVVRQLTFYSNFKQCQILFVGTIDEMRWPTISNELGVAPVLTVSDADDFLKSGGMIQLTNKNGQMRFAVNQTATKKSGLQISSQMLEIAERLQ